MENGECVCTLEGHAKTVSHVVVDWPSWRALSADDDGIIKLWDLKSADCIRTIKFQACHGKGFMDEISIHEVVADWPKQRALVAYGHVIKLWNSRMRLAEGFFLPLLLLNSFVKPAMRQPAAVRRPSGGSSRSQLADSKD